MKPYKKIRSDEQNRYYWGVLVKTIATELGYFPEEMHEVFKQKFLKGSSLTFGATVYEIAPSTSKLSSTEFEEYQDRIREFAASKLHIFVPLPNEVDVS
jgi:hypothetical protein